MEDISDDVINTMIQAQDAELERWFGRLFLLAQTEKGREMIQGLLHELNDLIEKMTDEAQRHLSGEKRAPTPQVRPGQSLNVVRQVAPAGEDRESAQAAVLGEFVRYALGPAEDGVGAEEAGQRKLVVALSLWPELSVRLADLLLGEAD